MLTREYSHVSYDKISFDDLLSGFLSHKNISYEDVSLVNPGAGDADQRGKLGSIELLEEWKTFHRQYASLQLISEEANLRRLNQ